MTYHVRLTLTAAAVFDLFVYGEKLLLSHKMNKPLLWYVVLSSYTPSASKLSSKSLMFTFRTISQPRACITQHTMEVVYSQNSHRDEVEVTIAIFTEPEVTNCFSKIALVIIRENKTKFL